MKMGGGGTDRRFIVRETACTRILLEKVVVDDIKTCFYHDLE